MTDGWDDPVWPEDDDLLPEQTSDDTDRGWNERQPDNDLERFLRERPPHHGD